MTCSFYSVLLDVNLITKLLSIISLYLNDLYSLLYYFNDIVQYNYMYNVIVTVQ